MHWLVDAYVMMHCMMLRCSWYGAIQHEMMKCASLFMVLVHLTYDPCRQILVD
jgi:hypothetical protein